MESLNLLEEKRDGRIKGRTCAVGSTQREHISKEKSTSPTAATEEIFITGVIESKEERDVMTLDMPTAFLQTTMPTDSERNIMKTRCVLVDVLVKTSPEAHKDYVTYDEKKNIFFTSACLNRYTV